MSVLLRSMRCAARARQAVAALARDLRCGGEERAALARITDLLTHPPLREHMQGAILRASPVEEPPRWGLRLVCDHERRRGKRRLLRPAGHPLIERIEQLADAASISAPPGGRPGAQRITCLVWQRAAPSPALDFFARCACPECQGACPRSHLAHVRGGITTLCMVTGFERSAAAERAARAALDAIEQELDGSLERGIERASQKLALCRAAGLALARIDPARGRVEHIALGRMRCQVWPRRLLPAPRGRSRLALRTSPWQPGAILWLVPDAVGLALPRAAPELPDGVDARAAATRLIAHSARWRTPHPAVLVACACKPALRETRPLRIGS